MGLFGKLIKGARRTVTDALDNTSGSQNDLFQEGSYSTQSDLREDIPQQPRTGQHGALYSTNSAERQLGLTYKARSVKLHKLPNSYVVVDLETTGLDSATDGIVEIGAAKVVDGVLTERFETLVDTDARMSAEASRVNGITRDMLKGAPKIDEAMRMFVAFADGMPLLGHNAIGFDRGFIEHACVRIPDVILDCEWYDTMRLAKDIYGGKASLGSLCERHGITNERAHRALSDAIATHECYQAMRSDIAKVTTDARDFPKPSHRGSLHGEIVCITGECPDMCRHDVMQLVVDNGGELANSVTKKVTMLVDFEGRESGKVKRARELESSTGVRIVEGCEFFAIVD